MKAGKEGEIETSAFTHQNGWESYSLCFGLQQNNDYVKSKLLLEWFIIIDLPTRFPNTTGLQHLEVSV